MGGDDFLSGYMSHCRGKKMAVVPEVNTRIVELLMQNGSCRMEHRSNVASWNVL